MSSSRSGGGGRGDEKLGEYWKTFRSSPASRVLNPELHTKPNKVVAALGTGTFLLILGNLAWTKYCHERALAKAKAPPQQQLEHVIQDDD